MDIVIVGSGILGLTTANVLIEKLTQPFKLTIISELDPVKNIHDFKYTSSWAGAHYRPFPSKNKQDEFEARLTRATYSHFKQLPSSSSVRFIKGVEHLQSPSEQYKNRNGYNLDNFKRDESNGFLTFQYDTWVINPEIYLTWLYSKLSSFKVTFINMKLHSLSQVNEVVNTNPIIINCTGLGLMYHGGYDKNSFVIRGQTLLIDPPHDNIKHWNETITYQLSDGSWIFNIPRYPKEDKMHGGMILGGTKQINDTYDQIRDEDVDHLIKLGKLYFPKLMKKNKAGESYFDVKRYNLGFRPGRKNGLRLDIEYCDNNIVLHNYGAGGMGYELSYGAALEVYKNLQLVLNENMKL